MVFRSNVFVLAKSKSEGKDGKTYYNGSVQFEGEDESRRVSIDKELYEDLDTHASYEDATFEMRQGFAKESGKPYTMFIMKHIG